jgi:hypothetical protein
LEGKRTRPKWNTLCWKLTDPVGDLELTPFLVRPNLFQFIDLDATYGLVMKPSSYAQMFLSIFSDFES